MRYLTTFNIKSAYWQIPLSEELKRFTAFIVPNQDLFQYFRMPMGLYNAPAKRFIDRDIGNNLEPLVFVYQDDVILII